LDTIAVGRRSGYLGAVPEGHARSGELLADDLAHRRAVGAAGDLGHDIGHDAAEVAQARCAVLGDRVVDDRLELVLRQRLGHDPLEHVHLVLFLLGLLPAARRTVGLDRVQPVLALALQDLELLVLVQRPLDFLLRRPQRAQDQPQRVAALGVAFLHRVLQLGLEARDQCHAGIPWKRPPRMCQWRWKTVWPAPAPTNTISLYSSSPAAFAVSATKSTI